MIETLLEHFSVLEDPRCAGQVEHRLLDIVLIAVCSGIACAESFEDMALYGRSKLPWLQQFLPLPNGIPSHETFRPGLTHEIGLEELGYIIVIPGGFFRLARRLVLLGSPPKSYTSRRARLTPAHAGNT